MNRALVLAAFALATSAGVAAAAGAAGEADGKALFEREWTPAIAKDGTRGDGLGPLFHARSCDTCHPAGERGEFKFRADGVIEGNGILLKAGAGESGDPVYGGQIQPFAVPGLRAEGVPAVRFRSVADASGTKLQKPKFKLRDRGYGPLDDASWLAGRVAQAIRGNGELEQVAVETLAALADAEDRDGDGISGRLNRIELPTGKTVVGRFGWKAGQWSLMVQTAKAFRNDMSMSSRLIGPAWGDCTPTQKECHEAPSGERDEADGREVATKTIAKIAGHVAGLPTPPPLGSHPAGEKVFGTVGCAACHVPRLPLPNGGMVRAYTDLLLHDMGSGLADGMEEGSASGSEWRTAPLVGLGRLLGKGARLLHDGRARNANEAILWHAGEAEAVVRAYRSLNDETRRALIEFLGTL